MKKQTKKQIKHRKQQIREILFIIFFISLPVSIIGHAGARAESDIQQNIVTSGVIVNKNHVVEDNKMVVDKPVDKELTMKEYVLNEWDKVGQKEMAEKVINCESHWNMNATNINTNKTFDISLYQFNNIHIKSGLLTVECLGDYKCQTRVAIEMWKHKGWTPWVCSRLIK